MTTWAPTEGAGQDLRSGGQEPEVSTAAGESVPCCSGVLGEGLQSVEPEEKQPLWVPARQEVGCWPGILTCAEGSGPKDTLEKPSRVVTASCWSCLLEEAW